mmetsp:Transcript_35235/g.83566  ORF Transcript_35235/g.83566 Transcript_35235/m.83566 type:complete len:727 (-) Transcript_35235:207-2387(-)
MRSYVKCLCAFTRVISVVIVFFGIVCFKSNSRTSPKNVSQHDHSVHIKSGHIPAIVVTIHGAVDYLSLCLDSLVETTTEAFVILADDSANQTDSMLVRESLQDFRLPVEHIVLGPVLLGYTVAVNRGLRRAFALGYQFFVCLNSDTELTSFSITGLVSIAKSMPDVGMVGPLGNAASFQSVPHLTNHETGEWNKNPLENGWNISMMAKAALLLAHVPFLELPILNGFVMLIQRQVLEVIGFMNEEEFPYGYGEENDFAIRCASAGFKVGLAPHVYVWHHKTKSYTSSQRQHLLKYSGELLKHKYGTTLKQAVNKLRWSSDLLGIRNSFETILNSTGESLSSSLSVLFVLNIMGEKTKFMLHGGWISLVQEAVGLCLQGAYSRIAVSEQLIDNFNNAFPVAHKHGIFVGLKAMSYSDLATEITSKGVLYDYYVATHWSTVEAVKRVVKKYPNAIFGYYVQDIETGFSTQVHQQIIVSKTYFAAKSGFVFVKTKWLQQQLLQNFNVSAYLISPTLDTKIFFSRISSSMLSVLSVCAMIRIETARRNPLKTLEILIDLKTQYQDRVIISIFGSAPADIQRFLFQNNLTYNISALTVLGKLNRNEIADLLRRSDVFLDFSEWQAFGRSGLEAMGCGCVPMLPMHGGTSEYAVHLKNSILIDTRSTTSALLFFHQILTGKVNLTKLRIKAIETAKLFSIEVVSTKTFQLFRKFHEEWRVKRYLNPSLWYKD